MVELFFIFQTIIINRKRSIKRTKRNQKTRTERRRKIRTKDPVILPE